MLLFESLVNVSVNGNWCIKVFDEAIYNNEVPATVEPFGAICLLQKLSIGLSSMGHRPAAGRMGTWGPRGRLQHCRRTLCLGTVHEMAGIQERAILAHACSCWLSESCVKRETKKKTEKERTKPVGRQSLIHSRKRSYQ